MIDKKVENFLTEYKQLCDKYKIVIDACGCCRSPYVIQENTRLEIVEHIEHLKGEYENGL